jgi:polyisoprenoid-binding protein YceI
MKRILLAAALATAFAGSASAATYRIDPRHTQVHFTYSHFGNSNLSGRFMEVTGELQFDPAQPAQSSIQVQLPMSSLSTGVEGLDQDLSSEGWFDVAKFPTASFKSSKVTVRDATHFDLAGDLTIHGVTRPAVFAVTVNRVGLHPMRKTPMAGFDAVATIKRSEFGVNGMAGVVPDEVQLRISMEAGVPKAAAAAPVPAQKKG